MRNLFAEGPRLYLRPVEPEDAPRFQVWMNDPENRRFLNRFRPLNGPEERGWIEKLHAREGDHVFGIALKEGDRLIGCCGLHRAALPHRSAELGIAIGDRACQGRGFGAEAVGLLLAHGFGALGLHRIFLHVLAHNLRGIRCYEKCGFRREGVLREAHWGEGGWRDAILYGLLEHEFREAAS